MRNHVRWVAALALAGLIVFPPAPAAAWWRQALSDSGDHRGQANAVALDGNGDAVAGGAVYNGDPGADFTVVKFSGGIGAELWRQSFVGPGRKVSYS